MSGRVRTLAMFNDDNSDINVVDEVDDIDDDDDDDADYDDEDDDDDDDIFGESGSPYVRGGLAVPGIKEATSQM